VHKVAVRTHETLRARSLCPHDEVRTRGGQADHIPERAAIGEPLLAEAADEDRIVIMGARDDSLSEFAAELVERLSQRN
jgi:UDP-N-acetylmuramate--alanine ligase